MRKQTRIKTGQILIIDCVIMVVILSMFIFVKCRHRDAFTYKGDYKNIDIKGTWYKVDLDEITVVVLDDDSYVEKDTEGKQLLSTTYEIGNHAFKLGEKELSMHYVDEKTDLKDLIENDDVSEYEFREYFYTIDKENKKIFYFKEETDAADQVYDNCQTNEYYEKSGMFDEDGYAIDEEGFLLAYKGNEKEITLPLDVVGIAENAMSADYDRALNTEKVIIPSNVKKIQSGAFSFSNVGTVVVSEGVVEIEEWAFGDSLIKDIYFPSQIQILHPGMFETEEGVRGLKIHCPAGSQVEQFIKSNPPEGDYEVIND